MKRGLILMGVVLVGVIGAWMLVKPGQEPVEDAGSFSDEVRAVEYHKISAKEAKDMIDKGGVAVLLDVRTQKEFSDKRIKGAKLLPNYEITQKAGEGLPVKDAVILVYCQTGGRSAGAARELVEMGYTKVYDMGGIVDWSYDTISGQEEK